MNKFFLLVIFPVFLFSGVFEHLLNKDISYLNKHNFRCSSQVCITPEKNILNNDILDESIKYVKTHLDNDNKVFKITIELDLQIEGQKAFLDALIKNSERIHTTKYSLHVESDKYGNHPIITILDIKREHEYVQYLSDKFYKAMESNSK